MFSLRRNRNMQENTLNELGNLFLALSDKTRLRLLSLMANGEVSVGYLADQLGESQPKISRHLERTPPPSDSPRCRRSVELACVDLNAVMGNGSITGCSYPKTLRRQQ